MGIVPNTATIFTSASTFRLAAARRPQKSTAPEWGWHGPDCCGLCGPACFQDRHRPDCCALCATRTGLLWSLWASLFSGPARTGLLWSLWASRFSGPARTGLLWSLWASLFSEPARTGLLWSLWASLFSASAKAGLNVEGQLVRHEKTLNSAVAVVRRIYRGCRDLIN